MLLVFSVLVGAVVVGGWLPGMALIAAILLTAGACLISANQLHPGWYGALILAVLVLFPGMIGLLVLVAALGLVGYVIDRFMRNG